MILNTRKYTMLLLSFAMTAACSKPFGELDDIPSPNQKLQTEMSVDCSFAALSGDMPMTKGIIGQTSSSNLAANFIKLDEQRKDGWKPSDYKMEESFLWSDNQTKIIDADILSAHDNTDGIFFRSVVFKPRQTYQYTILPSENQGMEEIVGYASRMIGWYPRTFDVPTAEDGTHSDVVFKDTDSYAEIADETGNTRECVIFKNKLDGQTDIMMTDMRMGRIDLRHNGFRNNQNDIDIQPYGHQFKDPTNPESGYAYCNYFTFNHYLTAVRVYLSAENSDISLIAWKQLKNVVFRNQPRTVAISLPQIQNRDNSNSLKPLVDNTTASLPKEGVEPIFGKVAKWEDYEDMQIIKTPMCTDDREHPEFADTPSYPVVLENDKQLTKTYLGYMLIQPDRDTEIELHTDAGILTAVIPRKSKYIDADGKEIQKDILKAGNIYNINIKMNTDGSLDMIVGFEDYERFRNLAPFNPKYGDFEYANCYVITPEDMKIPGSSTNLYDGFYFNALKPGRGDKGMIEGTSAQLYPDNIEFKPHTAKVLWQDQPYLITHVELIHDHVRFALNPQCQSPTNRLCGNAVIAIYDEAGEIIWSWHIWVTDQIKDITYNSLRFLDVEDAYNFGDNIYNPNNAQQKQLSNITMMNMNLGATKATWNGINDILKTYGLYYQWGRKDPTPGPPSYNYAQADLLTSTYYYMDQGNRNKVYEIFESNPIVKTGAMDPLGLVAPSQISETYPNDWLYSSIDYLWGYSPVEKKVVKKTIYDPCPYGYRVADDELWALFYNAQNMRNDVNIRESDASMGYIITGTGTNSSSGENWFPFTGWRGHDRGRTDKTHAWYEVGNLGDYQDARVCKNSRNYSNHRGRSLIIKKSMVPYKVQDVEPEYIKQATQDYANRTSASPVRCIRYNKDVNEEPDNIIKQ